MSQYRYLKAFIELTIESTSPQTTLCLYNSRLVLSVKNPSLPATSSLQSLAISFKIPPVSFNWSFCKPNVMHFPTRCLKSESHRELSDAIVEFQSLMLL